jgi:hypothetical protein
MCQVLFFSTRNCNLKTQEQRNPRVIHSKPTLAAFFPHYSVWAQKSRVGATICISKKQQSWDTRSGLKLRDLTVAQNGQN